MMKKNLFLFVAVFVIVLFAAGLSAEEAKAIIPTLTPAQDCQHILDSLASWGWLIGGHWDPVAQQCLFKFDSGYGKNSCYPNFDALAVSEPIVFDPRNGGVIIVSYFWKFGGCVGDGSYIKDPNRGEANLGDGISFQYENQTCANGCDITKFGLTGAAKNALGSLKGKVLGKTYVQIRDDDGNLVSGDFKLCYYAKGAANPYFFRYGGSKSWSPFGGYWNGNNFCMSGTTSGNYVLVDMP